MLSTESIVEQDVRGVKYLDRVLPLLRRLHDAGCARDKAGNRRLHYDQYCALILLFMFNPMLHSLRAIQRIGELKKVQQLLGCGRASLGSLSEAVRVFDPKLLQPLVEQLKAQLQPHARDSRLADIKRAITLVDGTLIKALARITEAMWLSTRTGTKHFAWRLHTQFSLVLYVPTKMTLTDGRNSGPSNERNVLRENLTPDQTYVFDRGYPTARLWNEIHSIASNYVCRIRDNSRYEVVQERPLTAEARAAEILFDGLVRFAKTRRSGQADHPQRLVIVQVKPHEKRSNRKGNTGAGPSDGQLRIVTDLLDVPAEIVALIYQYRFQIELFFRFFKHLLGCRHLLSDKPQGIEIQVYCAIIACMLLSLWIGRKPTLATLEMFCYYFIGLASEEELEAHLRKLQAKAS